MKLLCFLSCLFMTACAGSAYESQNMPAKEIDVDGRIIRVIDLGDKVQMIRKGYFYYTETTKHYDDFRIAGEKATGCKLVNIGPRPGIVADLPWVLGWKKCPRSVKNKPKEKINSKKSPTLVDN